MNAPADFDQYLDMDPPPEVAYGSSCTVSPSKQSRPKQAMPASINIDDCFNREPPPFDFILPGFLVGTVGMLVSPGGTGKSMLALQVAGAIATGNDQLGLGIKQTGSVLVVVAEDPHIALHHRLHSMGKHYSPAERKQISDRCDFRCTVGLGIDIMNDDWFEWLLATSIGKRLVVIDTLTRIHKMDEKDSSAAAQIMTRLEVIAHKNQCGVLVLHHINKSAAMAGEGDTQQAARGSCVFIDNARWASFLAGMDKKEAEARKVTDRWKYVRWNVNKQNYSPPMDDKWFERGGHGILALTDFRSVGKKAEVYAAASGKGVSYEQVKVPVCSF